MSIDPKAEEAFAEFIERCGTDSWKIPSSCETFLTQYLAKFPAELELLVAALRVGVAKRIAGQDARVGYDDFLSQLADKFATAAGTDREAATWVVGAWAFGVGKPVGYAPPEEKPAAGRRYDPEGSPPDDKFVYRVMTLIVVGGGALGAAIGAACLPIILMATDVAVDHYKNGMYFRQSAMSDGATLLLVLAMMVGAAAVGALGAWAGWYMGSGAENPWASFGVACGAAFTTTVLLVFFVTAVLKPVVLFGAVFGATFKSAARGGREFV